MSERGPAMPAHANLLGLTMGELTRKLQHAIDAAIPHIPAEETFPIISGLAYDGTNVTHLVTPGLLLHTLTEENERGIKQVEQKVYLTPNGETQEGTPIKLVVHTRTIQNADTTLVSPYTAAGFALEHFDQLAQVLGELNQYTGEQPQE